MKQHVATFANFVCRFGKDKVLLDYAKDIVLPAFFDDTLIRTYGTKTQFFFYEMELNEIQNDDSGVILGVSGRFIKNTQLTREQIFDPEKGIIADEASLQSSPSAFFLLILNNHRLIYFPETAHAPDLKMFRSTAFDFIKRKHKAFIDKLHEELNNAGQRTTKKELYEAHPYPTLEIIPVSGDEEVENFVRRYGKLTKLEIRLIATNDEIDGSKLFSEVRERLSTLDPNDARILASDAKDGLDIEAAISIISDATETDNHEIKLSGKDQDGNTLIGDNHEFNITTKIDPVPATRADKVRRLFESFTTLLTNGSIKIGAAAGDVSKKLISLIG